METGNVLVCGAGPVGLAAALELARHGIRPRIIEAGEGPTELSKALVVWRRTLKVFDAEIPFERFLERHGPMRSARLASNRRELRTIDLTEGTVSNNGFPTGILVPQSDTERILIEALSRHGVEVEWNHRLTEFNATTTGVDGTIEHGDSIEKFRAGWLLGCDGGHSATRKSLELPFPGTTHDQDWIISDVEIISPADSSQIRIEFNRAGVVAIFPIGHRRWRVMAELVGEHDLTKAPTVEDVQRILDQRTSTGWKVGAPHWLSHFRVNERQVQAYRHGRVFLAGDAAHVHSPAGGQGMNTGIQDAQNLAWKLALHLKGGADESLLDTYQEERHPVGRMVVKGSARLLRFATFSNPLACLARNTMIRLVMATRPGRRRFQEALSEETVSYRSSSLADRTRLGRIRSGGTLPDGQVSMGGAEVPLHHLLRGCEAAIIVVGDPPREELPNHFGVEESGFPITVRRLGPGGDAEDRDGRLSAMLGGEGSMILVRPDTVVATVSRTASDLQKWIDSRFGRVGG
ncbi:MAG: FAD-binding monooxygenase [Phycisphaera sp. TMED9]|nr:MAG: FAD-binding monooxygenase [Phycisphaera sp. TMED9]